MESPDEVNLKSRFFQVGESSRKDFTFKPFSSLCLELGDSCKLKQCAFVSPFTGNLTLKSTSNSVVINRHRTHRSLQLTSLELVFCFLLPPLKDPFTPLFPNSACFECFRCCFSVLFQIRSPSGKVFLMFLQCLPLMLVGYPLPLP